MARTAIFLLIAGLAPAWAALAAPVGAAAGASSPWFARVWQSEDGLPENNVTGLAQTSDGYLWISTHNGLVRFDGVQFERIPLLLASGRSQPLIRAIHISSPANHTWSRPARAVSDGTLRAAIVCRLAPPASTRAS